MKRSLLLKIVLSFPKLSNLPMRLLTLLQTTWVVCVPKRAALLDLTANASKRP